MHNEMSSPTEAPPLRSEEQDVPGETLGSAERQRLSLDVTMSSVSDGSSGVHSETNFGGASAEEQSNDTDQLMADSASHKDLLLRSGAEQEETLALHRAAAQSVEQHIAGANHASLNGARNESCNETTRGTGALPIMWGVAQAPGARLITAA